MQTFSFYFTLYSFLTEGSMPSVKKTYSWALGLKGTCYDLKSLESDNRTTLVLSNTRELDRVPSIK